MEEELLIIKKNIEKYILKKDYENAFAYYLLHIGKFKDNDKEVVSNYYYYIFNSIFHFNISKL
jgi:hypothetical protein